MDFRVIGSTLLEARKIDVSGTGARYSSWHAAAANGRECDARLAPGGI